MKKHLLLVVNPGSSSTKMALFEDESEIRSDIIRYESHSLQRFATVWDQYEFRLHRVR